MSDIATTEHTRAPAAPKSGRTPRISTRVRDACDLIASKQAGTIKDAAAMVGLSREHLSRELGKPHVQAFITRESRRTISMGLLRASHRMVDLIDAQSEHVSLDAAKHVAAIAGIKPPSDERQLSVNVGVSVGYVLDLTEPSRAKPTVTIDALPNEER